MFWQHAGPLLSFFCRCQICFFFLCCHIPQIPEHVVVMCACSQSSCFLECFVFLPPSPLCLLSLSPTPLHCSKQSGQEYAMVQVDFGLNAFTQHMILKVLTLFQSMGFVVGAHILINPSLKCVLSFQCICDLVSGCRKSPISIT